MLLCLLAPSLAKDFEMPQLRFYPNMVFVSTKQFKFRESTIRESARRVSMVHARTVDFVDSKHAEYVLVHGLRQCQGASSWQNAEVCSTLPFINIS